MRQFDIREGAINEWSELNRALDIGAFELLVVGDFVQYALNATGQCSLIGIHQRDGYAALHVGGRDALPHYAGSDNTRRRDFSRRHVVLDSACFFAAIAQEEHIEEGAVDW